MNRPFSNLQEKFLTALTETLFDGVRMVISPQQVVDNIQEQFAAIRGSQASETATIFAAMQLVLGPGFTFVDVATRRRRIEDRLINTKMDLLQDLSRLRGIIMAGYYGHWVNGAAGAPDPAQSGNPVLDAIGFVTPAARVRSAPECAIEQRPDDLPNAAFVQENSIPPDIDVIVIGSGAGGGVAAHNLAKHGHKVLVVERGPHIRSTDITHQESQMTARLYHRGALQFSTDSDIVLFQGSAVGGSTLVNNGICLRMFDDEEIHPDAEDVVAHWNAMGANVDKARIAASYDAVEQRMGIVRPGGTAGPKSGRNNGVHLIDAWKAYAAGETDAAIQAAPHGWFHKSWGAPGTARECVYCGYCNTGCAYGRRRGAVEAFLKPVAQGANSAAVPHPLRILADAKVTEILWDRDDDDGARSAVAVRVEIYGGSERVINVAKGVVVAAGTMASSRILQASGVPDSGSGCSLNIACPVIALMPPGTAQNAWDEDQMTSYVDCGDYLLESHFQPPMSMSTMVPGWFDEHHDRMQNYNRLVSAGILFPADRRGYVHKSSMKFKLEADDLARLRRALATLVKVHFAGGALEVYPALLKGQTMSAGMSDAAIDYFFEANIKEPDDVVLSSSHPQGGNPINADPDYGIVDERLFLHSAANVMVTDASVFPSCIRVNGQLTTMAMAHYATGFADPFA